MPASPLKSRELTVNAKFTSGQPPPTRLSCTQLFLWPLKAVLCSTGKDERKRLSELTSFTHRVSDEILQRASLDILSYQI